MKTRKNLMEKFLKYQLYPSDRGIRKILNEVYASGWDKNSVFSKKGDDGSIRHLSLLWKKSGEYRGAFAAYKINQYNWSGVTVYMSDYRNRGGDFGGRGGRGGGGGRGGKYRD